jgi:hypothetical protein
MSRYFNYFPKTNYNLATNSNIKDYVTNIISRYAFENKLKENSVVFYEYNVQEGDTPEIIAYKFYGKAERHWIILMFNDIFDPQYDWPLNYQNFNSFVDKKYSISQYADTANTSVSGLSWAMNENHIHSYYKIVTRSNPLGSSIVEELEVDANTYTSNVVTGTVNVTTANNESITITTTKDTKTYYEYENDLNESKRKIKLLKKDFVDSVEKEFLRVING